MASVVAPWILALLARGGIAFLCVSSCSDRSGIGDGAGGSTKVTGAGGLGGGGGAWPFGSCNGAPNHDTADGGACTPTASVASGIPCTVDCCVPCGIDGTGQKICTCPNAGVPYAKCTCVLPPGTPDPSLLGPCSPQGYSTSIVPADAPPGSISLRGVPCSKIGVSCYTADSSSASQRACVCLDDGLLHCTALSHQWPTSDVPTTYN